MNSEKLFEAFSYIDNEHLKTADSFSNNTMPKRRVYKTVLIAALIASFFTLTAFAIGYNIYQQRQQQLRDALDIDLNNVQSYTEFNVEDVSPAPESPSVTILSAMKDGETETVFLSISPVERHEVEQASYLNEDFMFSYSLDGGESFGLANIYLDNSILTEEDWEISTDIYGNRLRTTKMDARLRQALNSYDEESKSLVIRLSIPNSSSKYDLSEPQQLMLVSMSLDYTETTDSEGKRSIQVEKEQITNYGTVTLQPIDSSCLSLSFPSPIDFENPETGGKGQIIQADIYPTNISFHIRHDGMENIYQRTGSTEPLPMEYAERMELLISWDGAIMAALAESRINFADGSSKTFPTGVAAAPFDGERLLWPCSWAGTIDLSKVQSLSIGGREIFVR